jgi:hypothetical protein
MNEDDLHGPTGSSEMHPVGEALGTTIPTEGPPQTKRRDRRDPNASTAGLEPGTPEWHKARARAANAAKLRNRELRGGPTEREVQAHLAKRGVLTPNQRTHIDRLKTSMKPTRLWWTAFVLLWAWIGVRFDMDSADKSP